MANVRKRGKSPGRLLQVRPVFHVAYLWVFAVVAVVIGAQYVATHAASYPITVYIQTSGTSSNISVYSLTHSFGTCNVGPGSAYAFGAPTTCQGDSFGATSTNTSDSVTLVAPSSSSGNNFASWSIVSNGLTGGSVSCNSSSPSGCVFSVPPGITGSITIRANYATAPPPSSPAVAPTLSGSTASTTAVNLSWSAGSAPSGYSVSDYLISRDNTTIADVNSSTRAYQATGLACGSAHTFAVQMYWSGGYANSNAVTVTTSACPASPTPTPKPPATPTPTPKSGGTIGPGKGATGAGVSGDTTPPAAPTDFAAGQDGSSIVVNLVWHGSTDSDTGVKGYNLDRSVDNVTWASVATSIIGASYTDATTQFGVHYYYRLSAVDNAGNASIYATADLITATFQSTATAEAGQTITSSDNVLTITIPAGALVEDVACTTTPGNDTTTTGKLIAGDYELTCKDEAGNDITKFYQTLVWTFALPAATAKPYGNIEAVAFNSGAKPTVLSKQFNRKTSLIVFSSATVLDAGIIGIVTHNAWPIILELLFVIMLVLGVVYYVGLRRLRSQNYDDYLRNKYTRL
jgi:hypothetical protein